MRVVDGPHESPELFEDGIPYISATAINDGKIDFSQMRGYISKEYCDLCDLRYKPRRYDILVIKLGASTGQVGIVETDKRFNIWVPLAAVRCNKDTNPYFVYFAFQSSYFWRQMELSWTFGTQQTLGVKTIEQLRIMLPPLQEQNEIVSYLKQKCDDLNAIIDKKTKLLTELENYKKSLIYEYVTGKREVEM
jgi:type I restriction enzyme S subunit